MAGQHPTAAERPIYDSVRVERGPPFVDVQTHREQFEPGMEAEGESKRRRGTMSDEKEWTRLEYQRLIWLREYESLGWRDIAVDLGRRVRDVKHTWEKRDEWRRWSQNRVIFSRES